MEPKKTNTKKRKEIPEVVNKLHEKHLKKIRKENSKARKKRKRKFSESSLDELIKKLADEVVCEGVSKIRKADEAVCENTSIGEDCENIPIMTGKVVFDDSSTIKDETDEENEDDENTSVTKSIDEAVRENIAKIQQEMDNRHKTDYVEWTKKQQEHCNSVNINGVIRGINILENAMSKKKGDSENRYCASSNSIKSKEVVWATSSCLFRYIRACILRHDWKPMACLLEYALSHKQLYYGYIKEVTFLTSLMLSKENPNIMESMKQCFRRHDMSYTNKYDVWYVNDD